MYAVLLFAEKVHADHGPRQCEKRLTPRAIPPSYKNAAAIERSVKREARSMDRLKDRVNEDTALTRRGRFLTTTFLIEVGSAQWLVSIVEGKIASVTQGPFVMPSWSFALRASQEEWQNFWSANPRPGSNDLMALIKRRVLTAEGNLQVFMANLRYFKESLEKLRPSGATA
jgi:hypothetical protein